MQKITAKFHYGVTVNGSANTGREVKIGRCVSETVQDWDTVTMES